MKKRYWVSSSMGTCEVHVEKGKIVWVCKLWGVFLNQPLDNLVAWLMTKQKSKDTGGVRVVELQ